VAVEQRGGADDAHVVARLVRRGDGGRLHGALRSLAHRPGARDRGQEAGRARRASRRRGVRPRLFAGSPRRVQRGVRRPGSGCRGAGRPRGYRYCSCGSKSPRPPGVTSSRL
jgi:hypothetical protein